MSDPSTSALERVWLATDASEIQLQQHGPSVMTLRFALPREETVLVRVFDSQGREVRTLANGRHEPGEHVSVWDGYDSQGARSRPGEYRVRIEAGGAVLASRLVEIR